jgi:hypothetical protein
MAEFLTEIPRWVTSLAFWVAMFTLLGCAYGVHRSFKGSREEINRALDDVYATLDAIKGERGMPARPLSAPLPALNNVRDIPTTRTAVARTDEAVESLKATVGIPTDPDKLTHQPAAATEVHVVTTVPSANGLDVAIPHTNEIPTRRPDAPGTPGYIGPIHTDSWAYVLDPDHKIEIVDGQTVPAFRDPDDTPTPEQLLNPTHPGFDPPATVQLAGATRLDLTHIGGRHRHPEDDE